MKRIQSACLSQTIHLQLKDDLEHSQAVEQVRVEYAHYKQLLERNRTQYKILEETEQPDGSILIRIKKQVNHYSTGDYLND